MTTNVSICLATYNGSKYILQQLASVIEQLGPCDEIVIVDDASDDGTVELVNSIEDHRIRLFLNSINLGYVRTFERAISLARGEILMLCDQDDIWSPSHVSALTQGLHTEQVVASNLATMGGPDSILSPYWMKDWRLDGKTAQRNIQNIFAILAGSMPYFGCAMAFRREALDVLLPFPRFLIESHDLWIALYGNLVGSIHHQAARTVYRRYHESNASPNRPRSFSLILKSRLMLLRCILELLRRLRIERLGLMRESGAR